MGRYTSYTTYACMGVVSGIMEGAQGRGTARVLPEGTPCVGMTEALKSGLECK